MAEKFYKGLGLGRQQNRQVTWRADSSSRRYYLGDVELQVRGGDDVREDLKRVTKGMQIPRQEMIKDWLFIKGSIFIKY